MKLIIKEIDRKSGHIQDKWVYHLTLEECFEKIKVLDNYFAKKYYKFKYEIIGE